MRSTPGGTSAPLSLRKRAFRAALLAPVLLCGCEALLSELPASETVFDGPIDGLSAAQLSTFLRGDEDFGHFFTPAEGLGPVFNQPACIACHPGDGRGHPATNLVRFGRGDPTDARAFDYLLELGGPQLQDHAVPGYLAEELPEDVVESVRGGPIVVGLGLIQAIPAGAILSREDPNDDDNDGIRGVANFVTAPDFLDVPGCDCPGCRSFPDGCRQLGRFGRKATAIDLRHQTVGAYLNDMGITSDLMPRDVVNPLVGSATGDLAADPEVGSDIVADVVFYLRTLRPPSRRNQADPGVVAGAELFSEIGCATCHVPSMRSSSDEAVAALRDREVSLYSDLLLHDMGDGLADGFPEGSATGRQWRTTPLWGLGIVQGQLGGDPFYLHDGRARTLEIAIEWHDGEARRSRDSFARLEKAQRVALLDFLRSL